MKRLKYFISIAVLAAVTFAVFCLPGIYFQNYRFGTVVEDMEQYSYDGLVSSNANAWQIYSMLNKGNYTGTEVYSRISSDEEQNKKMDAIYTEMVQGVFQKYLKIEENSEGVSVESEVSNEDYGSMKLSDYIREWLMEKDEWQVENVQLFNLKNIFDSRVVNVSLYQMTLQLSSGEGFLNICFQPDAELFYEIYLTDERYPLEFIDEKSLMDELYLYYHYSGEDGNTMSEKEWYQLQDILQITVLPGELILGTVTM